ncbi:hypothetical protein [Streptomyces litchfieldiae]|uniref:Uncharacterized protein n=1 Tax=Streptomyces litchfieldiae TaxID=3075543 RepID=A0ABU2MIP4_9ACTN|nr:hypothetical protein [Streptomyces sp. DSM 44938]MDT0341395.1 hypothetical protein [Streptomyces sp. DSM 44938]
MSHAVVRWSAVVAGSVAAFALCLWLAWEDPAGLLPTDEGDRLTVGTAFAGVVAATVGAAGGWWAARSPESGPGGGRVRQRANASGRARVTQEAGAGGDVDQRAKASGGARITQRAPERDGGDGA